MVVHAKIAVTPTVGALALVALAANVNVIMNRKQRRAKTKVESKAETKPYDPLDNSNDQPFKDHMLHMKEAHDIGHLLWLLNTGRLALPYHHHHEKALNLKLPFDVISENYYKTKPNIVVIDDFMNLEALQKLKNYCLELHLQRQTQTTTKKKTLVKPGACGFGMLVLLLIGTLLNTTATIRTRLWSI